MWSALFHRATINDANVPASRLVVRKPKSFQHQGGFAPDPLTMEPAVSKVLYAPITGSRSVLVIFSPKRTPPSKILDPPLVLKHVPRRVLQTLLSTCQVSLSTAFGVNDLQVCQSTAW